MWGEEIPVDTGEKESINIKFTCNVAPVTTATQARSSFIFLELTSTLKVCGLVEY